MSFCPLKARLGWLPPTQHTPLICCLLMWPRKSQGSTATNHKEAPATRRSINEKEKITARTVRIKLDLPRTLHVSHEPHQRPQLAPTRMPRSSLPKEKTPRWRNIHLQCHMSVCKLTGYRRLEMPHHHGPTVLQLTMLLRTETLASEFVVEIWRWNPSLSPNNNKKAKGQIQFVPLACPLILIWS